MDFFSLWFSSLSLLASELTLEFVNDLPYFGCSSIRPAGPYRCFKLSKFVYFRCEKVKKALIDNKLDGGRRIAPGKMDSLTKRPRTYRHSLLPIDDKSHVLHNMSQNDVSRSRRKAAGQQIRCAHGCAIMIQSWPLDWTLRSVSFPDCIAGLFLKFSGKGQFIFNNINAWGRYSRNPTVSFSRS
jgi:hypothetical protein